MDQTETSVIVALIPQDDSWCKIDPAHMTMVYVGETTDLKVNRFNELVKDVASIALLTNPIMAKVIGPDVMGNDERVDVFRISPTPEILAIRRMLNEWNNGDFPDFEPHVTIGPEGSYSPEWSSQSIAYPMYMLFDRIMLLWGKDRITFWLKKY